jgi:tripartite-type tricarboxylate transporter receptor subunit TctC
MSLQPVHAQSVEAFYSGKQIKLVVGAGSGGSYDVYGRLVAQFMTRHLPGHPSYVAPMMSGASGIIAANSLYNVAPRDGTELGIVGRAVTTLPLFDPGNKGIKYDVRKFNWIGSPQQEVGLLMVRGSSPIHTLAELKTTPLLVSGTTRAAPPSFYPRLLNGLFGTKFKVIDGYGSSQEAQLALERGEVDGHLSSSASGALRARIEPWLKSGKVRILAQIGLAKDPQNGNVPLILELAKTPEDARIMELVLAQQVMAWPIVAPPDIPSDRVNALRAAFDAAMKDPEFIAAATKLHLGLDPVSGVKMDELLARVYATPKDILKRVNSLATAN